MGVAIAIPHDDLAAFCRRHHIRRLSLFGSVLRDDFGPESDVDVLVEFEPDAHITYFDLVDIQDALVDLLGRQIDIGTPASLSPYIRDRVLASAQVIYEHL
jgi:predicted nucleotidyltransferase